MSAGLLLILTSVPTCIPWHITASQKCLEDTREFIKDLNSEAPRSYAVLMYDASGKLGSNIISGNTDRLGSFRECHSAKAISGNFKGQYCKLNMQQLRRLRALMVVQFLLPLIIPFRSINLVGEETAEREEIILNNKEVCEYNVRRLQIVNLSSLSLTNDMKAVLSKGSKFIPTCYPSFADLYLELKAFSRKLFLKVHFHRNAVNFSEIPTVNNSNFGDDFDDDLLNMSLYDYDDAGIFDVEGVVDSLSCYQTGCGKLLLPHLTTDKQFTPVINVPAISLFIRILFKEISMTLVKILGKMKCYNLSKNEWLALQSLRKQKTNFIFKCADKGGKWVIFYKEKYCEMVDELLKNVDEYKSLSRDPVMEYNDELLALLERGECLGFFDHKDVCFIAAIDHVLKCFSLQVNISSVLTTWTSGKTCSVLNGIRVLSLFWVISGHTSQMTAWLNLDNAAEWKETVLKNPLYVYSRSGPFYLAVDTFILISGTLSAKSLLNVLQTADRKLTLKVILKYYLNRLARLQPLHLYSICVLVALYSIIPWGPMWEIPKFHLDNCRRVWWTNVLLLNNFISVLESCNGWTWYIANDFQLYLTTPFILLLLKRNMFGISIILGFIFLTSAVIVALLSWYFRLPIAFPSDMRTTSTVMYFLEYYTKPYCRYGPFLVGILLGTSMYNKETSIVKSKIWACAGWSCCFVIMAVIITLAYCLNDSPESYSVTAAVYQALHRSLWAGAVAWIIVACEEGYGGFIKQLLSWSIWNPLASISYACYLVHPIIIIIYNGLQETLMHYTDLNMVEFIVPTTLYASVTNDFVNNSKMKFSSDA
ncbi:O-acyltransferase like protein-like [Protopterus annectens]|uniref:O-acyltransferase like protein-like n=1 Tax=Protopterus annectens TaxID=7888 RepID=UPI001CFB4958|nr:O-acyltransferase like protein-like [Protopterus annectens]